MYGNAFNNPFSQQQSLDRVNEQIKQLENIRNQMQQPVPITQNFQLAPQNRDVIKYAGSIEEVQREMVTGETPYFSKDMSVVWIKNTKGEIKTYELNEIILKDEKDLQIELLQSQINELKKEMKENERIITNATTTEDTADTKWNDETNGESIKENKSSSIQRVSTSKKK